MAAKFVCGEIVYVDIDAGVFHLEHAPFFPDAMRIYCGSHQKIEGVIENENTTLYTLEGVGNEHGLFYWDERWLNPPITVQQYYVGDVVHIKDNAPHIIRKYGPMFVEKMFNWVGTDKVVSQVIYNKYAALFTYKLEDTDGFIWSEEWLEPVGQYKEFNIEDNTLNELLIRS